MVITEDKSNEKYLRELSNIISQIYKIGVLYNEAVKMLNCYHSAATAQRMAPETRSLFRDYHQTASASDKTNGGVF